MAKSVSSTVPSLLRSAGQPAGMLESAQSMRSCAAAKVVKSASVTARSWLKSAGQGSCTVDFEVVLTPYEGKADA